MKTRIPDWAAHAVEELRAGREVPVRPRGHSMQGRINDGDLVTVEPCQTDDLQVGDVVLARVRGRHYFHLVLHQVVERKADRFLIGSNAGRIDGWIDAHNIFGRVTDIHFSS